MADIKCLCANKKLVVDKVDDKSKGGNGFFQKCYGSMVNFLELVEAALGLAGQEGTPETKLLKSEKCVACKGKGKVPDNADRKSQESAAANHINSKAQEIQKLEAALGPGGSRHTLVCGDEMLEIGRGFNTAKSYVQFDEVVPTAVTPDGEGEKGGHSPTQNGMAKGTKGTNPAATAGGQYVVKAANKMSVYTGAQGFGVHSHGPIT